MKIALTSIYVNDPSEAFKFYTETLGFIEKMYMPEYEVAIVASPEDPTGTSILLEPNNNPIAKTYQEGLYNSGMPAMVFGTADIEKEYNRLKEQDVVFKQTPVKKDWGWEALFEDKCGNLIQLAQV